MMLVLFWLSSVASACPLVHTVEPDPSTLPPESEIVRPPNSANAQLRYKGAIPVIFVRKQDPVPIPGVRLPSEVPVAKIVANRQYSYIPGEMTSDGRMMDGMWNFESSPSAYPLLAPVPPENPGREGVVVAELPYRYNNELRKIRLKYQFKKVPGCE